MSLYLLETNPIVSGESDIIDPAEEHIEQSRADFAEYESAVRDVSVSVQLLAEPNSEQLGRTGDLRSRQGFDFDSFNDRS